MSPALTYQELQDILPQAYPFILIDKIEDYCPNDWLIAIKNVTGNEWQQGREGNLSEYFPETLLIEAAAQAALVLYHISKVKDQRPRYFLGRAKADFKKEVGLGEQLAIRISSGKLLDSGGYVDARVSSEKQEVAEMELIFKVITL